MEKFGISPSLHAESLFILRSLMIFFFPFKEDLTHQRLIRAGPAPCKVRCGVGPEDGHGQRGGAYLPVAELWLEGPHLPATKPSIKDMAAGETSE